MRTKDKMIAGFSKFSKAEKLAWLTKHFFTDNPIDVMREFASFWHTNSAAQKLFDGISENTITNFYMPFGVAPNFLINDSLYCVPMVIEESSVVAAASSGAKYWYNRGGFVATVKGTTKVGHVHFLWHGKNPADLFAFFTERKATLLKGLQPLTYNMEKRGGGIKDIQLLHKPEIEDSFYQIKATFDTCDAMGANFINSVLEKLSELLVKEVGSYLHFSTAEELIVEPIMDILSNYTPECLVHCQVSCPVEELEACEGITPRQFAQKMIRAVRIAEEDPYRATTHNKGIFNGIDALVIATGNDFRAIEACGHTYAARSGQYRSLSHAYIDETTDEFVFELSIPLAVGTVGGLTNLHPLAKRSLELLGNPSAQELMQIMAAVGLAQNFAALRSLVTTGIQKGHMKMHLNNILMQFEATSEEINKAQSYFEEQTVSFTAVRQFLNQLRGGQINSLSV